MKVFYCFSVLVLLASSASAQGNLQFNRVVNYTIVTPFAAGNSRPSETLVVTVPPGKVIKVESAHLSYQSSGITYYINYTSNITGHLVLNNAVIACFDNLIPIHEGPIWLAEGTHTFFLQGYYNSSSSYKWNAFVTGIEFNVVP